MCECLVPPGRDPVCGACAKKLEEWDDEDQATSQ